MIYVIMGPTASKKSDLAIFLHENLKKPSKIVNFDAFQVYKELDIGSAKPKKEELDKDYYLLYDYKELNEPIDIYTYQKEAREVIKKYNQDYDLIFVGGSGLYIKAALFNYEFLTEDIKMPLDYKENLSNEELYNELLLLDKEDALKIGINNRKRLLRSLFINEYHKINKTELNQNKKNELLYKDVKFIYIKPDREELYNKINLRVDKMFDLGLENEVKLIFNKYNNAESINGLKAIGYKEFIPYLIKKEKSLEEIKEDIKKNTRNYAKRQYTFFNHQFESVNVLTFNDINEAKENIDKII